MRNKFIHNSVNFFILVSLMFSLASYADDKKEMEDLGLLFAVSINANDFTRVDQAFDLDFFIGKVAHGLLVPERDREGFAKGMRQGAGNGLVRQMFLGLENQKKQAKFIGLYTIDNQQKPVIRVDYAEGGVNFIELELQKIKGKYQIGDIYIAANGQMLSDTVMQAGMMLMQQPTGLIAKLVDDQSSRENVIKTFRQAMEFKKQGDLQSMYEKLQTLPDSVKQNDTIALMMVMTSSNLNEQLYKQELEKFAKLHGHNPRYAFMLVDYYFYQQQYNKAVVAISSVLKRYEQDPSLLNIRAGIYMFQKQYDKAYKDVKQAVEKEPDHEDAYWTAVTISINQGNYTSTLDWLNKLETKFDYEFVEDNFIGQDLYKGFVASHEFNQWMASKSE